MPYSNGTMGDRGKYSEFGRPVVFGVVGKTRTWKEIGAGAMTGTASQL